MWFSFCFLWMNIGTHKLELFLFNALSDTTFCSTSISWYKNRLIVLSLSLVLSSFSNALIILTVKVKLHMITNKTKQLFPVILTVVSHSCWSHLLPQKAFLFLRSTHTFLFLLNRTLLHSHSFTSFIVTITPHTLDSDSSDYDFTQSEVVPTLQFSSSSIPIMAWIIALVQVEIWNTSIRNSHQV